MQDNLLGLLQVVEHHQVVLAVLAAQGHLAGGGHLGQAAEGLVHAQADAAKEIERSRAEMERERDEMLRGVQENVTELVLLTASKLSQKELDEESDRKLVDSFLSEAGDKP